MSLSIAIGGIGRYFSFHLYYTLFDWAVADKYKFVFYVLYTITFALKFMFLSAAL